MNQEEFKIKSKKLYYPKSLVIKEICLSGILLAMFIALKGIFKLFPIINGYDIQFAMIVLALGAFVLRTFLFRILFILISPLTVFIFGTVGNPFLDYLLPH